MRKALLPLNLIIFMNQGLYRASLFVLVSRFGLAWLVLVDAVLVAVAELMVDGLSLPPFNLWRIFKGGIHMNRNLLSGVRLEEGKFVPYRLDVEIDLGMNLIVYCVLLFQLATEMICHKGSPHTHTNQTPDDL